MKIQLKITILFTLLCLSVIVGLSVAVYYFANARAFQDFYTRLELRAVIASKVAFEKDEQSQETYENVRRQHLQRLPNEEEYVIRVDTFSRIKSGPLYKIVGEDFFRRAQLQGKSSLRQQFRFYVCITHASPAGDYFIIVSAVNSYAQNFLANLKKILTTVCIVSVIVVFSIGIIFSRQVLAPIRNIARRVDNISVTSLHERLEVGKGTDEISHLAGTFNDMLSRLETAFETQNNFVSNASHELNTPLTAIIGEADFALAKQRSSEDYRRSLEIVMKEGEKLQAITRGLLELAQSGFTDTLVYEEVKVSELMHNIVHVAKNVYPRCHIKVNLSLHPQNHHTLSVWGNAQLFELAISNILLNACKYSGAGEGSQMGEGVVTLSVAESGTHVVFIVSDNGIGIPENEIKHIYDPFFRASNAKRLRGYGIGLPLARNIIKLYKGSIDVDSKENLGTEVIVKIPTGRR